MKCYACGKENHTINYLGRNICGECWHLLHVAERTIDKQAQRENEFKEIISHKSGNYISSRPVWNSKIPFYITAGTGIAIIILMWIERTVN